MALTATAPILTARGDLLNEADGFIAEFTVDRKIPHIPAVSKTKESSGRSEQAAHTDVTIGNCDEVSIDADTGFVGMFAGLQYTELLCGSDPATLKQCVTKWFKTPTSQTITATLLKRDRGASQFVRKEGATTDVFVHPTQLLANVEVGASTRTWLVSAAAFTFSYHQISRAFEQCPRDFSRIDDHIDALQTRVRVLSSPQGTRELMANALASTKPPYPDFDYTAVAQEAVSRLCLLARVDLAVFQHLKTQVGQGGKIHKSKDATMCGVSEEQLRFLREIATANGDLWFERSAHTYDLAQQSGAIIVFPSGYLYSVMGAPGMKAQQLMKNRGALARLESLLPYVPYELSGYTGSIERLATLEVQARKGATAKAVAKIDMEAAKTAIATHALRLSTAMIIDPVMLALMARVERKVAKAISVASTPVPEPIVKEQVESSESDKSAESETEATPEVEA